MTTEKLEVAFLPVYPNPYQHLLKRGLEHESIRVQYLEDVPGPAYLARHPDLKILHFHWLSGLYLRGFRTIFRLMRYLIYLNNAQEQGLKIIWTAHNILPHREQPRLLHLMLRRHMMRRADAVITHCQYGKDKLRVMFPSRTPIQVIPHGNYINVYPRTQTRAQARDILGISSEKFVWSQIGNIAAYKNLEFFIEAFRTYGGPDDVVLIAGRNRNARLVRWLEQCMAADSRIHIHAKFIPENDLQTYLLASDICLLTYKNILTSATAILSLSFGIPVIAPSLGCLPELLSAGRGFIYDPERLSSLGSALEQVKGSDWETISGDALKLAQRLNWDRIAQDTADLYRACLVG